MKGKYQQGYQNITSWHSTFWQNPSEITVVQKFKTTYEGESQNLWLINHHFTTLSSHFFDIAICIFHKTEIQTVILRCWAGLNHNWFQSYEATNYSASFPPHYRRVLLSRLLVYSLCIYPPITQPIAIKINLKKVISTVMAAIRISLNVFKVIEATQKRTMGQ